MAMPLTMIITREFVNNNYYSANLYCVGIATEVAIRNGRNAVCFTEDASHVRQKLQELEENE